MNTLVNSEQEMIDLGMRLGACLKDNIIFLMHGELGAGKTCFTKGLALGLGIEQIIVSPTFNILKTYQGHLKLKHFDLYRLEGSSSDLGFDDEITEPGVVSVVEWPEYYYDFDETLPHVVMKIKLMSTTTRKIEFEFYHLSEDLVEELKKCIN